MFGDAEGTARLALMFPKALCADGDRKLGLEELGSCNYRKSVMKTLALNLAQIGNSRGIRLPAGLIRKHGFEHGLVLEDRGHEIALRPKAGPAKLSWAETAREMAAAGEDWSAWEATVADGLEQIPWEGPAPKVTRARAKAREIRKK